MFLMYVDESGDPGIKGGTSHFVLSGLIVHEKHWMTSFKAVKAFREKLAHLYGIHRSSELHANHMIAGRGALYGKRRSIDERITVMREVVSAVRELPEVKTIGVSLDKAAYFGDTRKARDAMAVSWTYLLQRFHNYLIHSPGYEHGIVIHDGGHGVEIRKLLRKVRAFNYVPSRYGPARNMPMDRIIEDSIERDSHHSQFIQLCDCLAYSLFRREAPVAKYPGLEAVFDVASPTWLTAASRQADGVVRIPSGAVPSSDQ